MHDVAKEFFKREKTMSKGIFALIAVVGLAGLGAIAAQSRPGTSAAADKIVPAGPTVETTVVQRTEHVTRHVRRKRHSSSGSGASTSGASSSQGQSSAGTPSAPSSVPREVEAEDGAEHETEHGTETEVEHGIETEVEHGGGDGSRGHGSESEDD
jgi:hypothetical protein